MKAVMLQVPESLLAERRRLGADRWDEMWDGVLHMPPAPAMAHQDSGGALYLLLAPIATARGLQCRYETAVHGPGHVDRDYRLPDLVFFKPEVRHERGVAGAPELVIEILSPNDESYDKLPWYAEVGTRELLLIDPITRAVELYLGRDGKVLATTPDASGAVRSQVLDLAFARIDGPKLRVEGPGVSAEV